MKTFCSKILLIEDDPADAELIRDMVETKEGNCVVATSDRLSSALKLLWEGAFEVVLLDLGLPDSSRLETLRRILERGPQLPIVVLTVTADEELAAQAIAMGAQDYLVKGRFDPDLLYRSMLYAVERKRSELQLKDSKERLRQAHNELEQRVRERTAELSAANRALSEEIAERKQAEEKLRRSSEELSNLSRRLQEVREEERKIISREIHDQVGQMLTVLEMELSFLIKKLSKKEDVRVEEIASIRDRVDEAIIVVRRIAAESRPMLLDDLGLRAAVEWQAAEFERRTGIKVKLNLGAQEVEPEQVRATAIFRILQEALTNVARHAKASGVSIGLKVVDKELLKLTVRDNGVGITEGAIRDANSTGLIGMRERMVPFNGSVKIVGSPKKGTTVTATVAVR